MKRFQNILVGVDLADGERLVSNEVAAPTRTAIDRAVWLASESGARLTFLHALDVSHTTERLIEEHRGEAENVFDAANRELAKLIDEARDRGVEATSRLTMGRSWYEMITTVLEDGHDLVIVGTREIGPVRRMLFGSTAVKLLRKCPCPVWVTKPTADEFSSVLVAHDLTEVGSLALELGASMANLESADLRVLHAIDHPELHGMFPGMITREESESRRRRATERLATELRSFGRDPSAIELSDDEPHKAIRAWIERHRVDLLVMGTVARTGVRGLLVGNTAERLLPELNCSVLAVKPPGFVCPVSPD